MSNPSILIQARLNAAQAEQTANKQLQTLEAKLKPLQLRFDSKAISEDFKVMENGVIKLSRSIHSASDALGNKYKIVQKLNKETDKMEISQVKMLKNNKKSIADKKEELRIAKKISDLHMKQFNSSLGIGLEAKSAKESASVFEMARIGKDKQYWDNYSAGLNKTAKSAKESASAFEDLFKKADRTTIGLNSMEKQTAKLNPVMKDLGVTTEKSAQSMSSVFGKILIWSALTTALFFPISMLREGLVVLKELDSAMVEIAKVTDLSAGALDRLKKSSFDAASAYGRTAQDFLSSVAVFSRAGYDTMASGLAEISLLAQNVGELTSDQADAFLLATDAAYKYRGSQEELGKVLDGVNQIDKLYCPIY